MNKIGVEQSLQKSETIQHIVTLEPPGVLSAGRSRDLLKGSAGVPAR
jgi:hypothetical protein